MIPRCRILWMFWLLFSTISNKSIFLSCLYILCCLWRVWAALSNKMCECAPVSSLVVLCGSFNTVSWWWSWQCRGNDLSPSSCQQSQVPLASSVPVIYNQLLSPATKPPLSMSSGDTKTSRESHSVGSWTWQSNIRRVGKAPLYFYSMFMCVMLTACFSHWKC